MSRINLNYRYHCLLAALAFASPAACADQLSANVGATSNYLWRGMEQTGGNPALSAGIDYSTQSGFYAGGWLSNADWAPGMTFELDLYGGYSGQLSQAVSFDVGYIYYAYPDEDTGDADFSELYGSLSYQGFSLGLSVLAGGTGADFGDTLYASADYEFNLNDSLSMALHFGHYSGDWLAQDTLDYGVSVSQSGFTLGLSDTDSDNENMKVYLSYTMDFSL